MHLEIHYPSAEALGYFHFGRRRVIIARCGWRFYRLFSFFPESAR